MELTASVNIISQTRTRSAAGDDATVPVARLQALGYQIVIIPSDLQRAAIRAMGDVLAAIARDGSSAALADRMASFSVRETVV